MSAQAIRKYNFRPSLRTINDNHYVSPGLPESDLPQEVDLRGEFTPVYDQLQIGSCVDNAVGALIERNLILADYKWKARPSRLFLYYNARSLEGTVDSDAGSTISDCVTAANEFGVCPESEGDGTNPAWLWTYEDDGVKFKTKPPDICYQDAKLHLVLKNEVVNLDRNTVLNALAARKPFAFGFAVHSSFESQETAKTGIMTVPSAWNPFDGVIGGHGVDTAGYILNKPMGTQGVKDWVWVRNSWGAGWGQDGYFLMPLDQILCNAQMASDAQIIDIVGVKQTAA